MRPRNWVNRLYRSLSARRTLALQPSRASREAVAMRALVVYESMYGNTERVAQALRLLMGLPWPSICSDL